MFGIWFEQLVISPCIIINNNILSSQFVTRSSFPLWLLGILSYSRVEQFELFIFTLIKQASFLFVDVQITKPEFIATSLCIHEFFVLIPPVFAHNVIIRHLFLYLT